MKIQSLSVLVLCNGCVNKCKFCVSRMHNNEYTNLFKSNPTVARLQFKKRLQFARENNCNTAMITGTGEALQNKEFLLMFAETNKELKNPFLWLELQSSGVMLTNENLIFLKDIVGVDTISLSLSNILDSQRNSEICGTPNQLQFQISAVCKSIKDFGFNLRLSLNMTKEYDDVSPFKILETAKKLGADQITFRKLYSSGGDSDVDKWVDENKMDSGKYGDIKNFVKQTDVQLEDLPFGLKKFSYNEMGVVWDDDCMSKEVKDAYKYLILRENTKVYSRWDDKGSLIF